MLTTLLRHLLPAAAGALLAGSALAQTAPPVAVWSVPETQAPPVTGAIGQPRVAEPLILLNSRIILGSSLDVLKPADIASIEVFRGSGPGHWQSVAGSGVVVIQAKKGVQVPARSLGSLCRQLHVRGPVRYELNGQPLQDEQLQVATQAIAQLAVRPPAPGETASVISIGLRPAAPHDTPPGVYLRGTDGR